MPENYGGWGTEYQRSIYLRGPGGSPGGIPLAPELVEGAARRRLPPEAYDYVAGGAGAEDTLRENLEAFRRYRLLPRTLIDVAQRDLAIDLFGARLPAPVFLCPVGALGMVHPEGEVAVAQAAADVGVPFVLSTASSRTIEEVADASEGAPRWFQLYWGRDPEVNASLLERAERAGFSAVVLTVDTKLLGWRERDLQRGFLPFQHGQGTANYLSDPVFRSRLARSPEEDPTGAVDLWGRLHLDPTVSWKDLRWLRERVRGPLLLKGIVRPEDARRALDEGIDGLIVSNHGGRQLEGSVAALDALPDVVRAVDGKAPVLFDSGIRRGSDSLKAIALGARAVGIGRPFVWGLALAGRAGVRAVLENHLADLDLSLALLGACRLGELTAAMMRTTSTAPGPQQA